MKVLNLHHVNIETSKLEETRRFYEDLLGLKAGPRPSFPTVGYFMYLGNDPIVHLLEAKTNDEKDLKALNRIDHFGLMCTGLEETRAVLKAKNIKFQEARGVANDRIFRLFVEDPNAVTIELAFLMDESRTREATEHSDGWQDGCKLYA